MLPEPTPSVPSTVAPPAWPRPRSLWGWLAQRAAYQRHYKAFCDLTPELLKDIGASPDHPDAPRPAGYPWVWPDQSLR